MPHSYFGLWNVRFPWQRILLSVDTICVNLLLVFALRGWTAGGHRHKRHPDWCGMLQPDPMPFVALSFTFSDLNFSRLNLLQRSSDWGLSGALWVLLTLNPPAQECNQQNAKSEVKRRHPQLQPTCRSFPNHSLFWLFACLVNKSRVLSSQASSCTLWSEQQAPAGLTRPHTTKKGASEMEARRILCSMPQAEQSTLSFINPHTSLEECHRDSLIWRMILAKGGLFFIDSGWAEQFIRL